jgi:hypothetical protein
MEHFIELLEHVSEYNIDINWHGNQIELKHVGGKISIMFYNAYTIERARGRSFDACYFDCIPRDKIAEVSEVMGCRCKKIFSVTSFG